ncbi:MAG TPA: sugar MFS transporter [Chitinophaga sp.]|uniref:sugar MFS transporter n=1 Tax=Chitinophaga sp. TaxID=1869181 RepID=UPI002BF5DA16|nr:sugar MFS transporter [Chitinophaga sp.]HVI43701.1 sugar MFS transporter [Chitinophaga sp.]
MNRSSTYPMIIIGILFFVFGFLTWLNGILIPYFKICLQLSNFQSLWVAFAAYIAYFVMALPSAWILKFTGYRKGMVTGLCVMVIGALLFLPAAWTRTYGLFLTGLFVTGTGLALLQTAANPYVAIIGPAESTAQRISFMGIANKTAGIMSQRILGAVFFFNADTIISSISSAGEVQREQILNAYAMRIVPPYVIIASVLLLLAVMIAFSKLPEVNEQSDEDLRMSAEDKTGVLQYPYLVFGVIALFVASGCEVIAIDGVILYGKSLGIPLTQARHFTEYTLYASLISYASGAVLIPRYLKQQHALMLCAVWGITMSIAAWFTDGWVSAFCVILTGLSTALLWGTIWGLSVRQLGRYTKPGSALLIMAVSGGATIPLLFGRLIDLNPLRPQHSVLLLLPCYAILFCFAAWGYRIHHWKELSFSRRLKTI